MYNEDLVKGLKRVDIALHLVRTQLIERCIKLARTVPDRTFSKDVRAHAFERGDLGIYYGYSKGKGIFLNVVKGPEKEPMMKLKGESREISREDRYPHVQLLRDKVSKERKGHSVSCLDFRIVIPHEYIMGAGESLFADQFELNVYHRGLWEGIINGEYKKHFSR